MNVTTMRLDTSTRDKLAEIARRDYQGVPLNNALERLIEEHEINQAVAAYERLRSDPEQWADYQAELAEWDRTAGDGLPDARSEYPETNR